MSRRRKGLIEDVESLSPVKPEAKPRWEVAESGDDATIWSVGDAVRTAAEAVRKAGIDLREWEVVEQTVNSWPTAMKIRRGEFDTPEQVWNWQVKLKLKRRAPKPIFDGIRELLAELRKSPPVLPRVAAVTRKEPHLLELGLYDAHFGKLCWGLQTGENYDLRIAQYDYMHAVDDLLELCKGAEVEKIILPVGNDFFNADNWIGTTARGTRVDCVDDRFQKVFKVGCEALTHAIRRCREIATVECLWIPGNHDVSTSWHLLTWLSAYFSKDSRVSFDDGPAQRKYRQYGVSLLGYTHGDQVKFQKLANLMPVEAKKEWSDTIYHAWRVGHFHKRQQWEFNAGDTFNGIRVDVLSSLSGTDAWHYEQGYVGNVRAAEAFLWSKRNGYVGHFSAAARTQREQWKKEGAACRR